jgi:hypothetical protein
MKLYEFENPLLVDLIAVVSKLQRDIKDNKKHARGDWTTDRFLSYLKNNGVEEIDRNSLFDLINDKKPPLSTFISSIKDNKVVFKGTKADVPELPKVDAEKKEQEQEKIVQNMAKRAQK